MSAVAAPLVAGAEPKRLRTLKRAILLGLGSVVFGALAGMLALGGQSTDLIALAAFFIPVAVWIRPQLGPLLILVTGLLIEQFPLGLTNGSVTVGVPITQSIPAYQGLGSLHLEPTDLLPLIVFTIYMIRSSGAGIRWWPRTQLSLSIVVLLAAMVFSEVWGMGHHGNQRWSLFECRPFIYFAGAYLLTSVIMRTRSAVYAVLWTIIVAELIKSLQGLDVWITTRGWKPEPENMLGHEEAVFFTLYFIVVAAMWLFDIRGRLRKVGTWGVPLVLFANMINDRRAAWLLLGFGLIVLVATAYRVLPDRRRMLRRVIAVSVLITAVYLPAYWNHTDGTLGKPADAVRSNFSPTPRDALSDEYRIDEDANLKFNIKQNGILGSGFGQLIDYALPMPGLVTAGDSGITYVPHNSVLYILMDMGFLGAAAFWAMLGAGIIAGCRLARCPDRLFSMVGAIVAAMVVAWALEGAVDMGFTFVRITMVMGCLLGLLEACRHMHAESRGTGQLRPAQR